MEKSMDKHGVAVGTIALLLIIAVIIGGYVVLHKNAASQAPQVDTAYVPPQSIVVAHATKGDTHIFSGAIPMTSTCNKVASSVSYDEVDGVNNVSVAVGVLSVSDGACKAPAAGAMQTFTASFTPAHNLPVKLIGLTVNGKAVAFTEN